MKSGKILPPTYFNSAIVLMITLHFVIPVYDMIDYPYNLVGVIFILTGTLLNLWTDRLFKIYATTVKPFDESSALIVDGPFQFSRNPMYLGGVVILFGLFLILGSLSSFLIIPVFIFIVHQRFILHEEQSLEKKFGDQFLEYKKRVRRWL